ncbi:MAG: hypothetical protein Q4G23_09895 [Clostridia bacterium]|nr:hypothetical protein [Clostridia bacterium]
MDIMNRKNTLFDPVIIGIVTFVALMGIIIGTLAAREGVDNSLIRETDFFSRDFSFALRNALTVKFFWTAILMLSGINIFFIPASMLSLFIKCYSYGYTSGSVVSALNYEGYFIVMTGLFMHNFLFAILSVFYSAYGINKSIGCFLNRRNYDYKVRKNKSFFIMSLFFFSAAVMLSFLEAYISVMLYEI